MTPEQKASVKGTWAQVVPIADTAAGLFYDRLFAIDPTTRPLFMPERMPEQRRKLVQALTAVVGGSTTSARSSPRSKNGAAATPGTASPNPTTDPSAPRCYGRWNTDSAPPGPSRPRRHGPKPTARFRAPCAVRPPRAKQRAPRLRPDASQRLRTAPRRR